jgi:DNA polymerase
MTNAPRITIDFESRSACDIGRGAWLYSKHASTEPLCLAYKIGNAKTKLWHPGYAHLGIEESPYPQDLMDAIDDGWLVEAHNRFFEYCLWSNIMQPLWGWRPIKREQWRCSAAKAAYYSLPRALENAVKALKMSVEKDMEGNKIMKKLCKPRKPTKLERSKLLQDGVDPDTVVLWHESVEDFERNWLYCENDVEAEHAFSELLPDLPPEELRIWQMDQDMNLRGIRCDLTMVRSALRMRDREVSAMNAELADIMGVPDNEREGFGASQRAKVKDWINVQGVALPDTQAATLDKFAERKLPAEILAAINIVREVNRSSTAKYEAMLERADPTDWRLRDLMMYHGASTGRWAGKGVQPHNFPRGDIKLIDLACQLIIEEDYDAVRALFGEVMEHLSYALRGAMTATVGRDLMVADFAAIEARVVFWLAGDDTALNVFRSGKDIYCDMATGIYGFEVKKKENPTERQFGKQAILGLGFEMGFVTFLLTCRKYDIVFSVDQCKRIVGDQWNMLVEKIEHYFLQDKRRIKKMRDAELSIRENMHVLVLMQFTVNKYRARYPEVKQMWRDQEEGAVQAIRNPGMRIECKRGRNTWVVETIGGHPCLVTYLASGKPLHYWYPKLELRKTPFKTLDGAPVLKPVITFWAVDPYTKKWSLQDTYGGKLVENITQATARDLMALAMVRADDGGTYDVLLSVHDELVCEVDKNKGNVKEFERLISETPGWAEGCPVDAEGWRGFRYRK